MGRSRHPIRATRLAFHEIPQSPTRGAVLERRAAAKDTRHVPILRSPGGGAEPALPRAIPLALLQDAPDPTVRALRFLGVTIGCQSGLPCFGQRSSHICLTTKTLRVIRRDIGEPNE